MGVVVPLCAGKLPRNRRRRRWRARGISSRRSWSPRRSANRRSRPRPISITAITGADLQDRGITDIQSVVQSVPGVSMRTSGPGQTELEMRGMTSAGGNSSTVGFYLDDMPLTRARLGTERQGGHRPEPLRPQSDRGAARPARHAVRLRLHGRHDQAGAQRPEPDGIRRLRTVDSRRHALAADTLNRRECHGQPAAVPTRWRCASSARWNT